MNNNDHLRDWYLGLADSDKQIFLAQVSHDLTIHAAPPALTYSENNKVRPSKA